MADDDVLIRLRGENSQLKKSLNESQQQFSNFFKVIKAGAVAIGGALIAKRVVSFGSDLISLYKTQEEAERRLQGVLRATGEAAGFSQEQMKKLASQMQQNIGIGDEVILNSLAITSTFKNIRGDEFIRATKAAADLSSVLGGDLKGATTQVAKALNDPLKGISALSRSGVSFSDQQKEQIENFIKMGEVAKAQGVILDELEGEFGGVAEEIFDATGKTQDWQNRIGDLGEVVGGQLAKALNAGLEALEPFLVAIETGIPILLSIVPAAETSEAAIGSLSETISNWSQGVVESFAFVSGIIENWSAVWEVSVASAQLQLVRAQNIVIDTFTRVIPEAINNGIQLATGILTRFDEFLSSLWDLILNNAREAWESLQAIFRGEFRAPQFELLPDVFEDELAKLPEIAERQISDVEKTLEERVSSLGAKAFVPVFEKVNQAVASFKDATTKEIEEIGEGLVADKEALEEERIVSKGKEEKEAKEGEAGKREDLLSLNKRISEAAAQLDAQKENVNQLKLLNEKADAEAVKVETERNNNQELAQRIIAAITGVTEAVKGIEHGQRSQSGAARAPIV